MVFYGCQVLKKTTPHEACKSSGSFSNAFWNGMFPYAKNIFRTLTLNSHLRLVSAAIKNAVENSKNRGILMLLIAICLIFYVSALIYPTLRKQRQPIYFRPQRNRQNGLVQQIDHKRQRFLSLKKVLCRR